jgi:hypothetical protein
VGLPELVTRCRKLRKLRREVGPRMKLRVWIVAPDQAQSVIAVEERPDRPACSEAKRAAKVPVLDKRQLRLRGTEDVIAILDWDQRVRGAASHETGLRHPRILKDERDSLARTDAHAQDAVMGFAQAQLGREGEDVAGAG